MRSQHPTTHRLGFTLVEMLVVISIILTVTGLTFPMIRLTLQSSAVNSAEGQVNNAISAARVFATRYKPFVSSKPVGGALRNSKDHGDGYSGAIVLFSNDNTLRIYENDQDAYDPTIGNRNFQWLELLSPGRNGYRPVPDISDLRVSARVRAYGIVRTGSGAYDVRLVPPPFALRFDRNGTLSQGLDDTGTPEATSDDWDRLVYISATGEKIEPDYPITFNDDRDGDGVPDLFVLRYDLGDNREGFAASSFDMDVYGPSGSSTMDDGRVQLPFGVVETVSGVLIVQPSQVPNQFAHPAAGGGDVDTFTAPDTAFNPDRVASYTEAQSASILNWAQDNGTYARIMLFNRYTGQDLTR